MKEYISQIYGTSGRRMITSIFGGIKILIREMFYRMVSTTNSLRWHADSSVSLEEDLSTKELQPMAWDLEQDPFGLTT